MPETPKIVELMRRLQDATARGKLRWKPGDDDSFEVSMGYARFVISRDVSEDGEDEYFIRLFDETGKMIQSGYYPEGDELSPLADTLYEAARDSAFRVGEIIDKMIHDLSK